MPAYLISLVGEIADPDRYRDYVTAATELVARFSGRMLVSGEGAEVLEGGFDVDHVVVFEFPDMASIRALWQSADYRRVKVLREGIAPTNVIALPGVDGR